MQSSTELLRRPAPRENKTKGTVMQIWKELINFQKYPENFAFQLIINLLFKHFSTCYLCQSDHIFEAIIYSLLHNLHECTLKCNWPDRWPAPPVQQQYYYPQQEKMAPLQYLLVDAPPGRFPISLREFHETPTAFNQPTGVFHLLRSFHIALLGKILC